VLLKIDSPGNRCFGSAYTYILASMPDLGTNSFATVLFFSNCGLL